MNKLNRFLPFTVSRNAVLSAHRNLISTPISARYVETIPSYRGRGNKYRQESNPLEDLENFTGSWMETARQYFREWDAEKIKAVTEFVKEFLDEGTGETVTYDVTVRVYYGGDVQLDSIMPENTPPIGEKSNYIRSYTERIVVKTDNPRKGLSELDNARKAVNKKFNINSDEGKNSSERQTREYDDRINPKFREHLSEW